MAIQDWEGAMILWGMVSGGGAILGQMKEGSGQVRGPWWNEWGSEAGQDHRKQNLQ